MTVIQPNSISGINSITVQTGQALNIHDANGNLIRNITSSSGVSTFSSLHVGSGTTTNTQGISVGTGCSIVSETVNNLDVYTNSSKRIRIQNDGKVGVNTDNALFNNTSQIASASLYHNDPKIGVQGSIVIGNISPTVSDDRELAFYRRGGTNPGTAMSTHKMGRIAWYGSSNDTTLPDRAYSIECVPNGSGWTAGSNRRASITFNNHEAEVLRISSGGQVGIGTSTFNTGSSLEVSSEGAYGIISRSQNGNGGYHVFTGQSSGGTNTSYITHNGRGYFEDGVQFDSSGEVLDSYEEGTWTPVLSNDGTAFTSITNSSSGTYTKIGRVVTISMYHRTDGVTKGSASDSDNVIITGLPFTPSSNIQRYFTPIGFNVNWAQDPNQALIKESTAHIELYKYASSGGNNTGTRLTVGNINTGSNSNYCIVTMVYTT